MTDPITAFYPAPPEFHGYFLTPAFFLEDIDVAKWLVHDVDGDVLQVQLAIKNPLDIGTQHGAFVLILLARNAGAMIDSDIKDDGMPWSFRSESIARYTDHSPEDPINLVFVPQVRDALRNAGYDGLRAISPFENQGHVVWAPLDSKQITQVT